MVSQCVEKQQWQDAVDYCQEALEIYQNVLPLQSTERETILKGLKDDIEQLHELIKSNKKDK